MSGHGMLKYFRPITHKKDAPEDKDPPERKELSNLPWPYLSKVIPMIIPPSSLLSIASYLYNPDFYPTEAILERILLGYI